MYPIARLRSVQPGRPEIVCTVELHGDKDPALPLRPGETVEFEFKVIPEGPGSRYYGYLMVESFSEAATIERAAGMSLLAVGDRYATSTVTGEERTARFALTVHENVPRHAFLVPQLRAGIIADGGSSLTASTRSVKQLGYRIAPFRPRAGSSWCRRATGARSTGSRKGSATAYGSSASAPRGSGRPP